MLTTSGSRMLTRLPWVGISLSTFIGCVVFAALMYGHTHGFEKQKVKMVDYAISAEGTVNAVFRSGHIVVERSGGTPFVAMDKLRHQVHKEARKNGVVLSDTLYVVDINLLHQRSKDQVMIDTEQRYFDEHPEQGTFILNTLLVCKSSIGRRWQGVASPKRGKGSRETLF